MLGCCENSVLSIPAVKWLYDKEVETFEHGVDYWGDHDDLVENTSCSADFNCGAY